MQDRKLKTLIVSDSFLLTKLNKENEEAEDYLDCENDIEMI